MAHSPVLEIAIKEKRFASAAGALIRDFQLSLASESVTALLGPSGVGKSTLLRLVAGIDTDYVGAISIDGTEAAMAAQPGFVFQDARLLPWLTAIANVQLADAAMPVEHAAALLQKVGLAGFEHSFPGQLSGGMQRRVALARALATNARLLLLDEPFVSLDSGLVDDLRRLLAHIFETERPTALLVTHTPEDAAYLADRVVVLSGQPAQIVLDLSLPVARAQRTPADREEYLHSLLVAKQSKS